MGFKGKVMLEMTKSTKKRASAAAQAAEERVSLINKDGNTIRSSRQRRSNNSGGNDRPPWTFSRLMKYLSLTAVSAMATFVVLGKENKVLKWEEYHNLLEPDHAKDPQQRCYLNDRRGKGEERCFCPDPSKPQSKLGMPQWVSHHNDMVVEARRYKDKELDIVILGDSITERWNGTAMMGSRPLEGSYKYKKVFQKRFNKREGGMLEGLAFGTAADTGPNLLWHLKEGLLEPLHPKVWMIMIGTNDLFISKCTDRFVVANILNVLKLLWDERPDAQFIIHGILPRVPRIGSTTNRYMGATWQRAQAINLQIKKFCNHAPNLHYLQGGPLFTEETNVRGRRQINKEMMDDGVHPTAKGLEVWGNYIVKQVVKILKDLEEAKEQGVESQV